uniref:Uncharacterized protein n=1 Tax=Spongospora subterranea TaxID=70186 RepID=A0A0H5QHM6_9EUKA|eukprot:CRZ01535.1 hypothetical protein [Spongospora subterranea]
MRWDIFKSGTCFWRNVCWWLAPRNASKSGASSEKCTPKSARDTVAPLSGWSMIMIEYYVRPHWITRYGAGMAPWSASLLFTGLDNGQIHLWNVDTGSVLVMKAHTNTVSTLAIAVTRRRDFLISSGYDGRVLVWDISKRKTINPCVERELHRGTSRTSEIIVVAYNPSSGAIFAGGNDNLIHIWDLDSYEPRGTLIGHTNAVTCLAFDANIVFSGSEDRTIRIWDGFLYSSRNVVRWYRARLMARF